MIGLDTNILLRAVLDDDPEQTPVARRILRSLTSEKPGFICTVTVLEFAWTMRARYKKPKEAVRAAFDALLRNPAIVFSNRVIINDAVQDVTLDFADALLRAECENAGCETILTFDKGALVHPRFQPAGD